MKQETLFPDPKKLSRREHPVESRLAAEYICDEGRLGALQKAVLKLIRENPGKTVSELALGYRDPRKVGRRCSELLEQGHLVKGQRRCTITGRIAATWTARTTGQ